MTQEEKEILIKDLCARLLYGVKIYHIYSEKPVRFNSKHLNQIGAVKILPYLRPMSSMTEEEKIELCIRAYAPDEMKTIDEKLYVIQTNAKNATDFYNEHHLDYRGLIPMGLALEAPEDMYSTKTE